MSVTTAYNVKNIRIMKRTWLNPTEDLSTATVHAIWQSVDGKEDGRLYIKDCSHVVNIHTLKEHDELKKQKYIEKLKLLGNFILDFASEIEQS